MAHDPSQPIKHVLREFSAADLVAVGKSTGDIKEFVEPLLAPVEEPNTAAPMVMTTNKSLEFPVLNDVLAGSSSSCCSEDGQDVVASAGGIKGCKNRMMEGKEYSLNSDSGEEQQSTGLGRSDSCLLLSSRSNDHESRVLEPIPVSSTEEVTPELNTSRLKIDVKIQHEVDPSCADGYLGDSDQPTPGSFSPTSHPQPRLKGIDRLRDFHMSLCGHLLRRDMSASEAQEVFENNRISKVLSEAGMQ